jgi:paraquat-inducible protein A
MQGPTLIACPECDLLQREPDLRAGGEARCCRCDVQLYRSTPGDSLDRALAWTLGAIALYLVANSLPIAALEVRGQHTQTTLLGAVMALREQGMWPVATLVFVTTILAPGVELAAMAYMLLPLSRGWVPRHLSLAFRAAPMAHEWGLVDVFMLGIAVSLIKLGDLATVIPGVALWSFGGLIFMLTAAGSSFDSRDLWKRVESAKRARA